MRSRVDVHHLAFCLPVITFIAIHAFSCGDEDDGPNRPPHVQITTAITDSATTSHRVTFRWAGWDDDGIIDHYRYRVLGDPGGRLPPVRIARADAATSGTADVDSSWISTARPQVDLQLAATTPVEGSDPARSGDWYTFEVVAVDDEAAVSVPDRRYFNAVTVAPEVTIDLPIGTGSDQVAMVSELFYLRWSGRDEDAGRPDRRPVGYQLKLTALSSSFVACEEAVDSLLAGPNHLIPEDQVVTDPADVTDDTFLATDWWPKRGHPLEDEDLRFDDVPGGAYAVGVRAIDEADAVTPDAAFTCQSVDGPGNVLKLDVHPAMPVNPHLRIGDPNLLGGFTFTVPGQTAEIEIPVGVPLEFEWEGDASWYGMEMGDYNWAFDHPDPECDLCEAPDGVGGWIGWGNHRGIDLTFREEDHGAEHVLYIKARDAAEAHEIWVSIRMQPYAFPFDRTALWVDDAKFAGLDDCEHDAIIEPMLQHAILPHLDVGEELDVWAGHNPIGPDGCQESSAPIEMKLSRMGRYELLYWNVIPAGLGSVLGSVTTNPEFGGFSDTEKFLRIYHQAGGHIIAWGGSTIGAFLGDYYPNTAWEPTPGTFLWDVVKMRRRFDRVGRGTEPSLSPECSGIVGLRATPFAVANGFPVGVPDPTGYDPDRVAIWFDGWTGAENPMGGTLATAMLPDPPLHIPGLNTLYTYISNSWSHAGCAPDCLEELCGGPDPSPFQGQPVILVHHDPTRPAQGRFVWIGAPIHYFAGSHESDVSALMRRLTDWVFE